VRPLGRAASTLECGGAFAITLVRYRFQEVLVIGQGEFMFCWGFDTDVKVEHQPPLRENRHRLLPIWATTSLAVGQKIE